jgi:Ras-related protein Rab-5C
MVEYAIKVILLGEASVGKSSIIMRFIKKEFNPYLPNTIGTAFMTEIFERKNETLKMNIWDTCGQERFMAIASIYYKDANVIFLVVDCKNEDSLDQAEDYYEKIMNETKDPKVYLVVNKIDLLDDFDADADNMEDIYQNCEFYDDLIAFHKKNKLDIFWVSAKNGYNIKEMFNSIADKVFDGLIRIKNSDKKQIDNLRSSKNKKNNKNCC